IAKINLAALPRRDPADDDVELLSGHDSRRKIHGEETREVLARSCRDRNVGHTTGHLALNSMGIGSGKRVAVVELGSEREHIGGWHLWPVGEGDAAGRYRTPIDHQFVQGCGCAEDRTHSRAGTNVKSLWDAVCRGASRVIGKCDLQVALG